MIRNAKGQPLYKRIEFKAFVGEKVFPLIFKAPPGKMYSQANIEYELERVIAYIDEKFPTLEFRMVELLPNRFNFIAVGQRGKVKDESENSTKDSSGVEKADGGAEQDKRNDRGLAQEDERAQQPDLHARAAGEPGDQRQSSAEPTNGDAGEAIVDGDRPLESVPCERPPDRSAREECSEHRAPGTVEASPQLDNTEARSDLSGVRNDD